MRGVGEFLCVGDREVYRGHLAGLGRERGYRIEAPEVRFGRSLCKNACGFSGLTRLPGLARRQDGFSGFWGIVPLARAYGPEFGSCAAGRLIQAQ